VELATARRVAPWWVLLLSLAFFIYFCLLTYCDISRPVDYGFQASFTNARMALSKILGSPDSPAARAGLLPATWSSPPTEPRFKRWAIGPWWTGTCGSVDPFRSR
jgi:hypothetical protein